MPKSTKKEHCIGYFKQPEFGQIVAEMEEYADDADAKLLVFLHAGSITVKVVGGPDADGDDDATNDQDEDDAGIDNSANCPGSPGCP